MDNFFKNGKTHHELSAFEMLMLPPEWSFKVRSFLQKVHEKSNEKHNQIINFGEAGVHIGLKKTSEGELSAWINYFFKREEAETNFTFVFTKIILIKGVDIPDAILDDINRLRNIARENEGFEVRWDDGDDLAKTTKRKE